MVAATIGTAFVPEAQLFPYEGIGPIIRAQSAVPRAEVWFNVIAGVVPVSEADEDRRVSVTCVLPRNYAYAIAETSMRMANDTVDTANTWDDACEFSMQNVDSASETITQRSFAAGESPGQYFKLIGFGGHKVWYFRNLTDKIFRSPVGSQTNIRSITHITDETLAGVVATFEFAARFYQYDVRQANHYAVNSPILIR